jgi:hypothetical protein
MSSRITIASARVTGGGSPSVVAAGANCPAAPATSGLPPPELSGGGAGLVWGTGRPDGRSNLSIKAGNLLVEDVEVFQMTGKHENVQARGTPESPTLIASTGVRVT